MQLLVTADCVRVVDEQTKVRREVLFSVIIIFEAISICYRSVLMT